MTLGIGVVSEKENMNTLNEDSEMLITILSCFAQAEVFFVMQSVTYVFWRIASPIYFSLVRIR